MSAGSEAEDDAPVFDAEAFNKQMLEQWATDRFRRQSGKRPWHRDWVSYVESRAGLAWPQRGRLLDFRRSPVPVRAWFNIQLVQGTINNGGVEYFLELDLPPGGRYGEYVRDLRLIGAQSCADGLAEILRLFPDGAPPRRFEFRRPLLQGLLDERRDAFDRVSGVFMENSEANYARAGVRLLHAPHLLRPVKQRPDPKEGRVYCRPL